MEPPRQRKHRVSMEPRQSRPEKPPSSAANGPGCISDQKGDIWHT
ncbi:hypothetical protein MY4824_007220, partial [Beauveria thailandica]